MRKFVILVVLSGLAWLFVVQKQNETAKKTPGATKSAAPATKPTAQTATASVTPRPVSEHNWMKRSLDRANEVKRQVVEQRKADGTR